MPIAITHIHYPEDVPRGLVEGHVVLSIKPCSSFEEDALRGQGSMFMGAIEWIAPPSNAGNA